jgi:MFS family permease
MAAYIILNFPSNFLITKWGTKLSICLGVISVVLGSWIRCLLNYWFYWTIVGMFFLGIAQMLLSNSMVNLSNTWFHPHERIIMTSLANIFSFAGNIGGFYIPIIWVNTDETDMAVARQQIYNS